MALVWIMVAAVSGVLAIAAGAAASHVFAHDPRGFALMSTGSQYALFHALALVALAALSGRQGGAAERLLAASAWLFVAGSVLFSCGLYLLALTGSPVFIWSTPFGGVSYMLGWALLGLYAWRALRQRR